MKIILSILVCFLACHSAWSETTNMIKSPDGRLEAHTFVLPEGIKFAVKYDQNDLILPSKLGLILDYHALGDQPQIVQGYEQRTVNERFSLVAGKTKHVINHYNEAVIKLKNNQAPELQWHLVVRLFDDGLALRYELPPQQNLAEFTIQWELTQFRFAADFACFGLNLGKFANGHEGEFDPIQASKIRTHHLYDAPLVCKTGVKQTTFALAEANVKHYSGAYFTGLGDGALGVQVQLTPRFDEDKSGLNNVAVKAKMTAERFTTPWRVLMVGDSPGDLVESNLINALAQPSVVADTSWIKPGKVAWDWWNDNQVAITNPGMNTETYKAYIDFAGTLGLEYIMVDAGWYPGSSYMSKPDADVTVTVDTINMREIVDYASKQNVGVWVWVQWQQLDHQMEQALKLYQNWGIKGIKVDFMDRFDQEMVDYYHKLLTMTAKYQLMVDLHGAYPPNGLARTYPHFLTQEGVLGAEYNKWSERITASHNVTLPFTRMLLGPMDYTPGGFRHLSAEQFKAQQRNRLPYVKTTRGQALAMYVVFDSPLQMLSDSPITYSKTDGVWPQPPSEWQTGLEFIKDVPVTWDETKVLQGDIGEYIVMARRQGETWYVGAMTNEQGRKLNVPLNFLKSGTYEIKVWQDGKTMAELDIGSVKRSAKQSLKLKLKPSGGAVAVINEWSKK